MYLYPFNWRVRKRMTSRRFCSRERVHTRSRGIVNMKFYIRYAQKWQTAVHWKRKEKNNTHSTRVKYVVAFFFKFYFMRLNYYCELWMCNATYSTTFFPILFLSLPLSLSFEIKRNFFNFSPISGASNETHVNFFPLKYMRKATIKTYLVIWNHLGGFWGSDKLILIKVVIFTRIDEAIYISGYYIYHLIHYVLSKLLFFIKIWKIPLMNFELEKF